MLKIKQWLPLLNKQAAWNTQVQINKKVKRHRLSSSQFMVASRLFVLHTVENILLHHKKKLSESLKCRYQQGKQKNEVEVDSIIYLVTSTDLKNQFSEKIKKTRADEWRKESNPSQFPLLKLKAKTTVDQTKAAKGNPF